MQRLTFFLVFILLICPAVQAGATTAVLEGIIRNLENRQPVAGARVTVGDSTAMTDENGDFSVRLPLTGRFVISVDAPGYMDSDREMHLHHGINHLNLALTPKGDESTVFGTVYDRILLRPLANVEVSLDGVAVRTGEDGQYRFDQVARGDRWLAAYAAGYKVTAHSVVVDARAEQTDLYLIADTDFAEVEGWVYDRVQNKPLALAIVRAGDRRAITDADGRFSLDKMLPGETRLDVKADGYARYEENIDLESGRNRLRIYLEPFDSRREIDRLRAKLPDQSRADWQEESLQSTRVEHQWPGVETVQERSLEAIDRDLEPRKKEISRISKEAASRRHSERFIRGAVYLKETGEYLGFVSFRLDLTDRQVRDVSLRAESNTRDISISRGKTRFHRRGNILKMTLDVDGYRGLTAIDVDKSVQKFEIHLFDMKFRTSAPDDEQAD